MNLEQLIASFRVDADDLAGPFLFQDEWIAAWLSEAQAEAAIRGRLILEDANPAVCQIAVAAGQASYELHRSIYEIADLRFVPAGQAKSVPLALVTREWLDDKRPGWRDCAGDPRFAIQTDRRLRIVATPAVDGVLHLEAYRVPLKALENDADKPELAEAHHRHLVQWALHRAFRGFHPQMFFANGGAPEDQPRSNSFGDAAAAAADRSVTQVQAAAPTAPKPVSPTNTFPQASPSAGANVYGGAGKELGSSGTFAAGAERVIGAQPPKPPAPAPAQAAASPPPVAQSAGLSYMDNNESVGRGIKDSWNKGNYGEAVGKTVAGTVGMFTNPLIDGAAGAFEGAKEVGRGLFGIESPAQAPAPTSTTAPGAQAGAGAGRGVVNPSMAEPSKPLQQPGPANAPSGTEVMPGVYRNGNSYGDSAGAALAGAQPGGMPSAQNMAAAENLALGLRPRSAGASAPEQPGLGLHPGMAAPQVAHSGNSWSAQNALRNAQVSASSIMNNGGSWDKHKGVSPERAYAAALENADFAARGAQAGMNQAAMRENAAIQREGMQQAGSTARAQMMEVGQNNRFGQTQGLARDKFGLEQETQGIKNQGASLISAMQAQIAQEKDPAKRQAIVQRMREVQGTQQADPYLVVPGGQQIDPTSQRAYNTPASVFNRQTGQWVQQPGQGGAQPSDNHLAALRANPKQADFFDQVYGKGAAARILGGG